MNEEMTAEFDTVASWTAEVAQDLGPDYLLPAGCRGSGSPASLRWLLDQLNITAMDRMLDGGAGVGGPAGFARTEVGVVPVLSEPEAGACRAARRLFGLPVVQAASELPFAAGTFDAAWSLGVLCTVANQPLLVSELRRVLTTSGRLGMLVFVADSPPLPDQPVGNTFPTGVELTQMLVQAGFRVENSATLADFSAAPALWQQRADEVEAELERRYGDHPHWQTAARQSTLVGRLLSDGELVGMLIVARAV